MAKFHLDRLKTRYGFKGDNYTKLMSKIITVQSENISKKIIKINQDQFKKSASKVSGKQRKFVIPDVDKVLPARGVFVNKGAQNGKLISDTLRDRLTKNMRDTLSEFKTKSGKPSFISQAGKKAGRINSDLINNFEKSIRKTFTNYTKSDPKFKVPPNVKNIAVTEARSSINPLKTEYAKQFNEVNKDTIQTMKRWVHNASLSRSPRPTHKSMNNKTVPVDKKFKVKNPDGGFDMMDQPHDPKVNKNQIIGCNCDFDILMKRKGKIDKK